LRLRVEDDGTRGRLTVPEAGSVDAAACVQTVDVLSDEALVAARSRLNPAAGAMLSALWVDATSQLALIIHHLAVDGVSLANPVGRLEHCVGPSITAGSRWRWRRRDVVCAVSSRLAEHAHTAAVLEQADTWRQVAATPAALPAVQPAVDTYASAGQLSMTLDTETTRQLLGEVPAAFHAGVQDILLIAYGLALAEFLGTGGSPVGIDVEGQRRAEELASDVDLSRTVGLVSQQVPGALALGGLSWAQVIAGEAALGPVVKDAKEQLRALPDGLTYGLLRYLNSGVELAGSESGHRFQLPRTLGWGRGPFRGAVADQRGGRVGERCYCGCRLR